jgi:hypothetical protein
MIASDMAMRETVVEEREGRVWVCGLLCSKGGREAKDVVATMRVDAWRGAGGRWRRRSGRRRRRRGGCGGRMNAGQKKTGKEE